MGRCLSLLLLVAVHGLSDFFQIFLGEFSPFLFSGLLDSRDQRHSCNTASDPQNNGERGEDRTVVQQQIHGLREEGGPRRLVAIWEIRIGFFLCHVGLLSKFLST